MLRFHTAGEKENVLDGKGGIIARIQIPHEIDIHFLLSFSYI
jgi:hypothetical protein